MFLFRPCLRIKCLSILLFAIVMAGCGDSENYVFTGGGANPNPNPNPGGSLTAFTNPVDGATGVALNTRVTVTFSEGIDPASITDATFTLVGPGAEMVPATLSTSGTTATLTPDSNLAPNRDYTATITTGARSLAGRSLPTNYSWTFTTGASTDGTAPTVTFTDPAPGETGVPINRSVAATFSEAMDPLTVNADTFTLTDEDGDRVEGSVSTAALVATFDPDASLQANMEYTARVTTGARDLAGNALADEFSWTFTTGAAADTTAPTVTFTDPENDEIGVPLNQNVAATFSEGMNPATINNATFRLRRPGIDSASGTVSGTVTYVGLVATFNPTGNLLANTEYEAVFSTGAQDLAGNALAEEFNWFFTTGDAADTTAPTVTFTDPEDDEIGVPLNQNISATFSEGMDPLTLNNLTFVVSRPGNPSVAGVVTYVGLVATFNPVNSLLPNTDYEAVISTGARDLAGNALADQVRWSFTTGAAADTTAPTVTATDPVDTATGVPINQDIAATFSEGMNPLTITNQTFTVRRPGQTALAGTVTYVGTVATFNPTSSLLGNTLYEARVTTGAQDLAGNALADDSVWTFTTGAAPDTTRPTVTSTVPADDATNVAVGNNITATFSEGMNAATITNVSFSVRKTNLGPSVPGAVTYNVGNRTATFNPTGNLDVNTTYDVTITTAVSDLAGNTMAQPYTFSFRTRVVNLAAAAPFGSYGGNAGITNQGLRTVVNGDIGTTGAATTITGFIDSTGTPYTVTGENLGLVTGTIYTGTSPQAVQGAADARTAYNNLTAASLPGGTVLSSTQLGNRILAPGIYTSATNYLITDGNLTLDAQNNPNAVWVFQMGSSLTVGGADGGTPRSVNLINGAQAGNVYWQVASAATINAPGGGTMVGTIIAQAGVTFSTVGNNLIEQVAVLNGRAIGLDASVTLVNTVVNIPTP
jgi:hypothetical protein